MKLTNTMKEAIIKKVVAEKFPIDEMCKKVKPILTDYFQQDPEMKKRIEVLNLYPEYVHKSSEIKIVTKFDHLYLNINVEYARKMTDPYHPFVINTDDLDVWQLKIILNEIFQAKKNERIFKKDLEQIFESVNTSKQLMTVLPELSKYLPEENAPNPLIPIEQINSVRKFLGGTDA